MVGYQPANKSSVPPSPPTSGSNIVTPNIDWNAEHEDLIKKAYEIEGYEVLDNIKSRIKEAECTSDVVELSREFFDVLSVCVEIFKG